MGIFKKKVLTLIYRAYVRFGLASWGLVVWGCHSPTTKRESFAKEPSIDALPFANNDALVRDGGNACFICKHIFLLKEMHFD